MTRTSLGNVSYLERTGKRYVILLHGLGGYGNNFLKVSNLINEGYGILLPDLLGHGKSDKMENLTIRDQASAIEELIQLKGLEHYVIGGNSYGGWITLYHQAIYHGASKLILIDSAGTNPTVGQNEQESIVKFMSRIQRAYPNNDMKVINDIIINNVKPEYKISDQILREIKKPVLIIWGKKDSLIPLKYAEHIKQEIGSSALHVIDEAGHTPHFEAYEKVSSLINDFLDGK